MSEENIKIKGHISIRLVDENGKTKHTEEIDNVITSVGKIYLAAWLAATSQSGPFMPYIAIGTGTTAVQASDTAMETEVGTRIAGTITSSTNVWESQSLFDAGNGTATISEAGLFTAVTSGTMMAHQIISPFIKAAADKLYIRWSISFS